MAFVPFFAAPFLWNHLPNTVRSASFTCHLEEISKLIYSTKPFLLDCLPYQKFSPAFDCFVLWLSFLDKSLQTLIYGGSWQLVIKKCLLLLLLGPIQ